MPKIGCSYVWTAILLLCSPAALAADSPESSLPLSLLEPPVSSSTAQTTPSTTVSLTARLPSTTVPTCESRTVNYITHTLPQQCLKANWTRSSNHSATATFNGQAGVSGSQVQAIAIDGAITTSVNTEKSVSSSTIVEDGEITAASVVDVAPPSHVPEDPSQSTPAEIATVDPSLASPSAAAEVEAEAEVEADSPLDNANFLSFEEWKKQNLAKIGQSPENVGHGRSAGTEAHRHPVSINNALDSLGDENEIELDFGAFGSTKSEAAQKRSEGEEAGEMAKAKDAEDSDSTPGRRKDAGVTCKERFNYASFDCAATVLKTNPRSKSSSSVLLESKDSYMLNECAVSNKFIIVELCDDILIDTVVLANFEFFSSTFRTVKISISDRYPVKADRWKALGTFEARNTREIQAFPIDNPLIWARYLRVEFLTHYGNEYYCPVSLVRVHGTTMMEEFRNQDDATRSDVEVDEMVPEPSGVASEPETHSEVDAKADPAASSAVAPTANASQEVDAPDVRGNDTDKDESVSAVPSEKSTDSRTVEVRSLDGSTQNSTQELENRDTSSPRSSAGVISIVDEPDSIEPGPNQSTIVSASSAHLGTLSDTPQSVQSSLAAVDSNTTASTANSTAVPSKSSQPAQEPAKPAASQPQPPAPSPSTQESFFKSVHKRLQMLESNSTLSLQYIEEQSRILRDAFTKVEKKQTGKAEKFLDHLNGTVIAELKGFRQQYDQLWQSTVLELESHREQYQREISAVSSRLTIIADELVWQKRIMVVQSTLLLLCLGLVVFARSGSSALELPLMQQMLNKSHNMLRLPLDSPPGSPASRDVSPPISTKRPRLRTLFHRLSDQGSDASAGSPPTPAAKGPAVHLSPAKPADGTAVSFRRSGVATNGPNASPLIRQTQSGPATPSGTSEQLDLLEWASDEPMLSEEGGSPALKRLQNGNRPSVNSEQVKPNRYVGNGDAGRRRNAVRAKAAASVHSGPGNSDAVDTAALTTAVDEFEEDGRG